jgi:hypothetical protein
MHFQVTFLLLAPPALASTLSWIANHFVAASRFDDIPFFSSQKIFCADILSAVRPTFDYRFKS